MRIMGREVHGIVRDSIPNEADSIEEICDVNKLVQMLETYTIYYRSPEVCPWGRGNLVLDLLMKDGVIYCMKYPLDMTVEQLHHYIKPLTAKLAEKMN